MPTTLLKNKLTIVIPTYNEEKYISHTINTIANQYKISGTKVIVADAFSCDNTREILETLKEYYKYTLDIEIIDGGKVANARNKGAELSKTKYTLFLDADSPIISSNNLYYNVNLMEKKELHLLTCKIVSVGYKLRTFLIFKFFNFINKLMSRTRAFAVGGFFLTRTDVFNSLGGFDESLDNSEDYWLSIKYDKDKFVISDFTYGQDDRRFLKMGYFGMIKLVFINFLNRNNIEHFRKNTKYWT